MWAGTAPIPVWSANNQRFRLNRGGNRQTNAAIHRIAITQIRIHPDAQAFIKRRLETGSTKREALRLLKRKLANVVYRTLLTDTQQTALAARPTVSAAVIIRAMMRAILQYSFRRLDIPVPPGGFATPSSFVQSFNFSIFYNLYFIPAPQSSGCSSLWGLLS